MRSRLLVAAMAAALSTAVPAVARADDWPPPGGRGPCNVSKRTGVKVPMRDGTILRADVYRPQTSGKVPVILYRTQYNKTASQVTPSRYQTPSWFASHCYIVVNQDVRGQYASEGRFTEFAHEQKDGYDSVEWAARRPGSNGKVGMYGSSYNGATQWLAAETTPPHLKTIIPSNTASDYYEGWTYEGGAFRLNFIEPWAMEDIVLSAAENRGDDALVAQLENDALDIARWMRFKPLLKFPPFHPDSKVVAPYFFDWLRHPTDSGYWKRWAPNQHYRDVKVPVLNFEGWYDAFLAGGVQNFTGMRAHGGSAEARANQRIVIGPWDHIGWGRPGSIEAPRLKAIGPVGNSPVNELMLMWWDHYLKGKNNGIGSGPGVTYLEMGANRWHTATSWPLPGTKWTNYYLHSHGHAASSLGDGTLGTAPPEGAGAADHYTYDPKDPAPSVGGHSCCAAPGGSQGPYDQDAVESRPDVLVYSSAPLKADTEVTGPITVTLYAASSAPNTDWTAKLVDLQGDGTPVNLNNGIVRASYRRSLSHPTNITPGKVYRYRIHVWPTSNLFKAGDSIRLEISSSDFPQFDTNLNTGAPFGTTARSRPAHQTVLHDGRHPSGVKLPVIPPHGRGATSFPYTGAPG